jgi:hypothetical protein
MSFMSQDKLLSILVTVVLLPGLTLKGLSFGLGCTVDCQSPPPPPEFLYATGINQILAFTIDPSSGALSAPHDDGTERQQRDRRIYERPVVCF